MKNRRIGTLNRKSRNIRSKTIRVTKLPNVSIKTPKSRKEMHDMSVAVHEYMSIDSSVQGYRKPNMTNLPTDLGKRIFRQIQNTKAPNYAKMRKEADMYEKLIALELERKNNGN